MFLAPVTIHEVGAKSRRIGLLIMLLFTIGYTAIGPGPAQAQEPTETPTPIPIVDYVEIQDGEFIGIERTVTFGDMAVVIALLSVLATVFILVAYKLVTDKLP